MPMGTPLGVPWDATLFSHRNDESYLWYLPKSNAYENTLYNISTDDMWILYDLGDIMCFMHIHHILRTDRPDIFETGWTDTTGILAMTRLLPIQI